MAVPAPSEAQLRSRDSSTNPVILEESKANVRYDTGYADDRLVFAPGILAVVGVCTQKK